MSTTTRSPPRWSASTSTPVSTRSGVAPRTRSTNRRPLDSFLPPITCLRNTSRIAARAGIGFEHADPRQHVVGRRRTARRARPAASHTRRGHRRCRPPRPGSGSARVREPAGRCAAAPRRRRRRCRRPAGSRPVARPAGRRSPAGRERAGRDVHHPGAGGQPDPVPGLRGDQRLVADDGEPQPAAGARAQVDRSGPRRAVQPPPRRWRRPVRPARRWRPSSDARPSPPDRPVPTSTTATLVNVDPTSAQTTSDAPAPRRHRHRGRASSARLQ